MAGNRGVRKGGLSSSKPDYSQQGNFVRVDMTTEDGESNSIPSPLEALTKRDAGIYIGRGALDKWRYNIGSQRSVVILGDSTTQGTAGGSDMWAERLARSLGGEMDPRLTAGAGYYGLHRSGNQLSWLNGDGEWKVNGTWTRGSATEAWDMSPYHTTYMNSDANATATRPLVTATTNGSTTVTSAALFLSTDLGKLITGVGIPPNTYVTKYTSTSSIQISQQATATGAPTLTLHGATLTWWRPMGSQKARYYWDCTTDADTTISVPSGTFKTSDVGSMITGTNIPAYTTITVGTYSAATLSAAATGSAVGHCIVHEGRTVSDLATTNTSTTITSATAIFTSDDVNEKVVGENIPNGAYIVSVTNQTTAVISAAATATASAKFLFIQGNKSARAVADMATTISSATVTSATASFTQDDVGRSVTGTGIPNNTFVDSVTNATTIVLTNVLPATQTNGFLQLGGDGQVNISHLVPVWVDGIASNGTAFTYSTDGGKTWVAVTQTATGGPILKSTTIQTTNPTTLIIRANLAAGTKSQTIHCGLAAYQSNPSLPGFNLYNLAIDGASIYNIGPGLGDPMALIDNPTGGGFAGLRPDLIIAMHTNDLPNVGINVTLNSYSKLISRCARYADIMIMDFFEQIYTAPRTAQPQAAMRAATKNLALTTDYNKAPSWSVSDGVTNTTTTITSATMYFGQHDVGKSIVGDDIPASTTIASVSNSTTAILSAAATASGSSKNFTITGFTPDTGVAYIDLYENLAVQGFVGYMGSYDQYMADVLHESQTGHNLIASVVGRALRMFS
jgi:hypothetical protein